MKNIFILISLFLLTWCTWNYQEKTIKTTPSKTISKTTEELLLEKQKAEAVLKQIKKEEDKVMSKVLDSFLNSEEIDIQKELLNTQNRYNDLLWPILEYEHEIVENQTWSTASWNTLSWSIINEQERSDLDELFNSSTWSIYSWEVKIIDSNNEDTSNNIIEKNNHTLIKNEDIPEYKHESKVWNSWTYKSYVWVKDICKWGLKMIKKDRTESWLFINSCNKMISSFELDFWWIKVHYLDKEWNKKDEFVTIN